MGRDFGPGRSAGNAPGRNWRGDRGLGRVRVALKLCFPTADNGARLLLRWNYAAMAISTLRKAAVLLLNLPYEQRSQLLGRLEPQQSEAVVAEMNGLGQVGQRPARGRGAQFAAANVAKSGEHRAEKTVPFQFLHDLPSDALLDLIADEHPQTIALILSCVPPQQAAAVFAELAMEDQIPSSAASPPSTRRVRKSLGRGERTEMPPSARGRRAGGIRGVASVIEILNTMAPTAAAACSASSPRSNRIGW